MSDTRRRSRLMLLSGVCLLMMSVASPVHAETAEEQARRAISLVEKDSDIVAAVAKAKAITDDRVRVKTFRRLAELQAAQTDYYGKLPSAHASKIRVPHLHVGTPSEKALRAFEQQTQALASAPNNDVIVRQPLASKLGTFIPDLPHSERLRYDTAYVKKQMPKPTASFKVGMLSYELCLYNIKLVYAAGHSDFAARQNSASPQVIYLEEGVTGLAALYDALTKQGITDAIAKEGKTYTLLKPLVVSPKAVLRITGDEVGELRMSEERGAYIVNAGKLFIVDTRVTGWREATNAPAVSDYANSKKFRPFIMTWSGSEAFFASSIFTSLGYSNSKSYGITISAGPERMLRFRPEKIKRPTAVIVDNSFRNLYYGFYCYEANDIALIGNEYVDNIIYGVDPHDYSKYLTIAYNTAYGSQKKHGIIISREVNDSSIVGNLTFENVGSGLMLERLSAGTIVYANSSFANVQDGLTIYESSCNINASNQFFANQRMGLNVRNSVDVGIFYNSISKNAKAGIHGYTLNLRNEAAHQTRDFKLDPYSDMVGFAAVGNVIEANDRGIQADGMSALYLRANQFISQSPKLFKGDWSPLFSQIIAQHNLEKDGVFMTRKCSAAHYFVPSSCGFREQGYFAGDGQDRLAARMQESACDASATAETGGAK